MAKLGINVFDKDDIGKSRGVDPKTKVKRNIDKENDLDTNTNINEEIKGDNLSTKTDTNIGR